MSNIDFQLPPASPHNSLVADDSVEEFDDDIDLCNEDTFGSGAVEEDWELNHNQLVGLDFSKKSEGQQNPIKEGLSVDIPKGGSSCYHANKTHQYDVITSPSRLNEEELEISNQQLAAAVEELVLDSDLDQDAIDPAIVSLRRQGTPSRGMLSSGPRLPPHYDTARASYFSNSSLPGPFSNTVDHSFDGENMRKIWKENSLFSNVASLIAPLMSGTPTPPPGFEPLSHQPIMEDDAILTAIKQPIDFDRSSFKIHSGPLVVKAEDLERELQGASSPRGPSPTFGISIPKDNHSSSPMDRSLPARSISPVFGSPSPSNLPIGTPPKHVILDMMHQIEEHKKAIEQENPGILYHPGASGVSPHHPIKLPPGIPPPKLPIVTSSAVRQRGPPVMNRMPFPAPLRPGNMIWPAYPHGLPVNTLMAQDVVQRLGLRMPFSSPANSPGGSPQSFNIPRLPMNQNMRRFPMPMPPNMMMNQGFRRMPQGMMAGRPRRMPPPQFGPGHLHPEHSKFVRMRQQQYNGQYGRRNYNHHREQSTEGIIGIPGDPYANIMTQREKEWVIRIQMMALQSDRPEIDDYYYQNYMERRLREGQLQSKDNNKTMRLITPSKPNAENKKYVPVQFVNSLGKLTASSVYNPRQIIDVVHSANNDEESAAGDSNTDAKLALSKRLVVYKTIEKAYNILISLEHLRLKLNDLEEGASHERECIEAEIGIKTDELIEAIGFQGTMEFDAHSDPIFPVMKIRKGKKLIARAMPFLSQEHGTIILQSIFTHLAILIKRDLKDGVLQELYYPISRTLCFVGTEEFINACSMLTPFTLTAAIKDQFGATIVCKLLDKGRELFSNAENATRRTEWKKFISSVADVIIAVANPKEGSRHARPTTPAALLENIPNIFSIFRMIDNDRSEFFEKLKDSFQQLILNN